VQVEADVVFVATGIKVNSGFMSEDLAAAVQPDSKAIKVRIIGILSVMGCYRNSKLCK
jgi:hypothetical protein